MLRVGVCVTFKPQPSMKGLLEIMGPAASPYARLGFACGLGLRGLCEGGRRSEVIQDCLLGMWFMYQHRAY